MLTRFNRQLALVNHAAVQVYPLRLISLGSLTRTEQTRYLLPRRHGGGPESAQQSPGPCTCPYCDVRLERITWQGSGWNEPTLLFDAAIRKVDDGRHRRHYSG